LYIQYNTTITNAIHTPTQRTKEDILAEDIQFGNSLVIRFLEENREITPAITSYESLELLNKFSNVEKLASLGDIKSVRVILNNISVDDRLFTQERKDDYLQTIDTYLGLKR
jgi:hypothetical protein